MDAFYWNVKILSGNVLLVSYQILRIKEGFKGNIPSDLRKTLHLRGKRYLKQK